jgi:hypothetical protein
VLAMKKHVRRLNSYAQFLNSTAELNSYSSEDSKKIKQLAEN